MIIYWKIKITLKNVHNSKKEKISRLGLKKKISAWKQVAEILKFKSTYMYIENKIRK